MSDKRDVKMPPSQGGAMSNIITCNSVKRVAPVIDIDMLHRPINTIAGADSRLSICRTEYFAGRARWHATVGGGGSDPLYFVG